MNNWKDIIISRSNMLESKLTETVDLTNYYFNKTAIIVGKSQNSDIIKENLNDRTILICIGDIIENFDMVCDFHICDNFYNYQSKPYVINDKSLNSIDLAIKIGCKNIIIDSQSNLIDCLIPDAHLLYTNHVINIYSLNETDKSIQISNDELKNIINFRNLVVIYYYSDVNYSISGLLRHLIKLFNQYKNSNIFLKQGLKIITMENLKAYTSSIEIDLFKILADMKDKNYLDNCIMFGIHPYGFENMYSWTKAYGQKSIAWQDDPHYFANFVDDWKKSKISIQEYSKKYTPLYISSDLIDYLITPSSLYFKNLDITEFDHKIKFMFYTLNPDHYNNIDYNNYDTRKNQIILSGAVGSGYKMRSAFLALKHLNQKLDSLIYFLQSPGYINNEHMTEMNYYNKLTEYKAAFVGHHTFPINYPLAKHIEILMCGCLGFYEKNPMLQEQLGLIEYVHYIPCTDNEGNLIQDYDFYNNWMNSDSGRTIALTGAKYVREKFGENYLFEYINFFKNC